MGSRLLEKRGNHVCPRVLLLIFFRCPFQDEDQCIRSRILSITKHPLLQAYVGRWDADINRNYSVTEHYL